MCLFNVKLCFVLFVATCSLISVENAVSDTSPSTGDVSSSTTISVTTTTPTTAASTSTTTSTSSSTTTSSTSVSGSATSTASTSSISSSISSSSTSSTSTSTAVPTALPICDQLSVMEVINPDRLSGPWYEFARRGYGTFIQNLQCLEMDIWYFNGTATVQQTFANDIGNLKNQTTYTFLVRYNTTNPSNYTVLGSNYSFIPIPVYKILDTDYDNYLIACSYLPIWEHSAAAFVYFRNRNTPDEDVYAAVNNASIKYADFQDMNLVYQGQHCSASPRKELPMRSMSISLLTIFLFMFMHK